MNDSVAAPVGAAVVATRTVASVKASVGTSTTAALANRAWSTPAAARRSSSARRPRARRCLMTSSLTARAAAMCATGLPAT